MNKLTLGDIQKDYLDPKNAPPGNPRMRATTWFKRHGLPNLAKLLEKVEKQIEVDEALSSQKGSKLADDTAAQESK